MDLRSWLSALGGAPAGGAAYGMAAPPVQNAQPMGLAVPPMARGTKLSAEMSYDGTHPREQEANALNHFRSYGPNMLADAFIPGYGAGGDAKAASEAYGEGRYGAAAGNALMAAMDFVPMLAAIPAAAKGIRAFHGSPHDFDRFDISKIGTGEGGAVKGRGINFTDDEGEAALYRKPDLQTGRVGQRSKFDGDGRVYEVEINASPAQFVDFDKPLKEQPREVQEIVAPFVSEGDEYAKDRRLGFYLREDRDIEAKLRDAGFPGMTAKLGGNTHHIVFDDRLITILRKYGIGGLIAGGGAYALTDAEYAQAAELLAQDGMNTGAQ